MADQNEDRFAALYKDRTVLVTGGTGFVGKVLVEKILRVMDVKKIYVLVRTRKGKAPNERKSEIFANPLFDQLKELKKGEIEKKVEFVAGDVSEVNLGLSSADWSKLCNEVNYVFHVSATIRFDEEMRKAVMINVRGTKYMLQLAKECKQLKVFCHVSTAYCHLNERVLYEKAYPPPADPHKIIKQCEMLDNDTVNKLTKSFLGNIPNSYAYTKALAESLVVDELDNLPIVILRPSVVIPIWKEPIPGWTDNINGPTGLLIAAGKGVLRTMYCKGDTYSDYVPVDVVVNSMLASVCDYIIFNKVRRIYNITSSALYKLSFDEVIEIGRNVVYNKVPLNGVFWYPNGGMHRSRIVHLINFYLFQWLPAVVVDALLVCIGYKPVLMRVQRRIWKGYEVFEYYANIQWDFNNEASLDARKLLTQKEKETYKLDGDGINYEEYFTHCTYAARRYILNEPDDTIPSAKRHMRVMYIVDKICKFLLLVGLIYLLSKLFT